MSSCVMTTSPSWQAACRAVRGGKADPACWLLIWSLLLWAKRSSSLGRSLSVTADSSHAGMLPSGGGGPGATWRAATNARCSYFARIQDSLSSLNKKRRPVKYTQCVICNFVPVSFVLVVSCSVVHQPLHISRWDIGQTENSKFTSNKWFPLSIILDLMFVQMIIHFHHHFSLNQVLMIQIRG